jgi:hypothetical protein
MLDQRVLVTMATMKPMHMMAKPMPMNSDGMIMMGLLVVWFGV